MRLALSRWNRLRAPWRSAVTYRTVYSITEVQEEAAGSSQARWQHRRGNTCSMSDEVRNNRGMTELHQAAYHGELDWVQNCLAGGLSVYARDTGYGYTPLHWAVDMGMANGEREAVAATLIKAGSNVNARDNSGRSVLTVAMNSGNKDIVQQLIAAGAVEEPGNH